MRTKIKTVTGFRMTGYSLEPKPIIVRYTADNLGKTLSLATDEESENGVMLLVPFEQIESMIKGERK